jgi:hypothetical protein
VSTEHTIQLAWRYAAPGRSPADREQATSLAGDCLADPDTDEFGRACCRCLIAWLALSRQLTQRQRSAAVHGFGGDPASLSLSDMAALSRECGELEIAAEDAELALTHLAQIDDPAVLDDVMPGFAGIMGGTAALKLLVAGRPVPDLAWLVAEIERLAAQAGDGTQDRHVLLALRAALLTASVHGDDRGSVEASSATDAIIASAKCLTLGRSLRSPLLEMLGPTLLRQATSARSSDDATGDIERVLLALERLPPDTPNRDATLIYVGTQLLDATISPMSAAEDSRVVRLLEDAGKRLKLDDPARVLAETMSAAASGVRAAAERQPEALDNLEQCLSRAAESVQAGHAARPLIVLGEACALTERYLTTGELCHLGPAEQKLDEFFRELAESSIPWPDAGRGIGHLTRGTIRIAKFRHFPDDAGLLDGAVSDLELAVELVPDDNPLHTRASAVMAGARALRVDYARPDNDTVPRSVSAALRDGTDKALAAANAVGPQHGDYAAFIGQGAAGLVLQALSDRNPGKLDQAIGLFAAACSRPAVSTRERITLLHSYGAALLLRYQAGMEARDLSNGIDRLEEARRAVEQDEGSPHASMVLQTLAEAYRRRGDPRRGDIDRAVAIGLASLREHAGDVLLQDNDENALGMGRTGAEDAFAMARWFLAHGRPGPAISAIEFGRGMVLHAATIGDELPDVLRQAGHEALAQEWTHERSRSDPDRADLRYRSMVAIEGSQAEARLLAAPTVDEIRSALAATDRHALVYLLPEDDDGQGMAVVVDRAGMVTPFSLPGLRTGASQPLRACEQARRNADQLEQQRSARSDVARQQWHEALGELCDWAWRVAVGPLLDLLPGTRGRQLRVVLVPVGQLGLVPWHASRLPAGRLLRYACAEAVLSYAASARQFTDAAGLLSRPWAERSILVADSRGSNVATASSIEYIRASYYPASAVFGSAHSLAPPPTPGSPSATPADVLAALPGAGSGGASVLHLGCHAKAVAPILDSYIDLGAGGRLDVREVLRQARRSSRPDSGGLVVLAACLSDLTETDYDEALTLATAFLSAGSAGVVGARWRVTEHQTALFMASFHRALHLGAADPAEALRAAQMWMLDPGRQLPAGMPKILADEVSQPDLADPTAWAAFAYQGR